MATNNMSHFYRTNLKWFAGNVGTSPTTLAATGITTSDPIVGATAAWFRFSTAGLNSSCGMVTATCTTDGTVTLASGITSNSIAIVFYYDKDA
uniref:Uncharacterized protein n=1 Tax=viral metagenome TaxID=1070528 RepID=A0A6M3LIQ1_9ZZZZ